jgi:glycosyltransferase 2 family protein
MVAVRHYHPRVKLLEMLRYPVRRHVFEDFRIELPHVPSRAAFSRPSHHARTALSCLIDRSQDNRKHWIYRADELLTRIGLFAFKIFVLAFLSWVFWPQFHWNELVDSLTQTSTVTITAVLILFALQSAMAALRWRWILRQFGYSLTVSSSLEAWLVGQCASQILPALIGGDAARAIRLRRYGVPTTAALVCVFIDRFAGFVALVVLSAFTVPLLTVYKHKRIPAEMFWVVGAACLLVGVVLLCLRWAADPPAFTRVAWIKRVQAMLRQVPLTKEALLFFAVVGFGTNLTVVISGFLLGRELNSSIDLYACFAILPLVTLLTFIPISVGGWGIREASMISAFALIDVPAASALAISIQLGLAGLALGIVGGLLWILLPEKTRDAAATPGTLGSSD